ncbi:ubiquitin carboxyl-terminal hydrolase 37-like [Acanthaster planci]|uniref:Ubiquitin carboxyl-terminal hydrolase 37-like n=1 Tax=Acanthaster planci TaxID=133434 RepID=A0A8B7ZI93_ACAPL|nr:ubiquitin carboxyl-terminal hydrolase 37-like [Acanthaster planci]
MTNYVGIYEPMCMIQGYVKYTSLEMGNSSWKTGNLELASTPTGQVVCVVNFGIGPSKKLVVTNQIKGVIFNHHVPRCNISLATGANINWKSKVNGKPEHPNRPSEITRFADILEDLHKARKRDKRPNSSAQLSLMSPQSQVYTPVKQNLGGRNSLVNHPENTVPRTRISPTTPRSSAALTPWNPSTPMGTAGRTSPNPMTTPSHIKAAMGLVTSEPNRGWESREGDSTGSDDASADLLSMMFMGEQMDGDKENIGAKNHITPKMGGASKSVYQMRKEEGGSLFMASFQEKQLQLEERKENTAPKPVSSVKAFYSRGRQAPGFTASDALLQPRQTNTNTSIKRTPGFLSLPQPKKPCLGNKYVGWSQRNVPTAVKTSQVSLQGFSNLGNTCYMNAILQSLFALDRFTMDVLNGSLLHLMQKDSLYKALASLFFAKQRNQSPDRVGTHLRRVKQAISSTATRFSGFMQHDAQEFLCQCLDQLKEDWEEAKQKTDAPPGDRSPQTEGKESLEDPHPCPVVQNFEFEVLHSIVCKQCGEVVTKEEQFYSLSLDMPRRSSTNPVGSVQTALEQFFHAETIEYACSECNCKQATVTHTFTRLPRVMIIHLKRYRFDVDAAQNSKLRRRILIPKYLSLLYHCSKVTQGPASTPKSFINGTASPLSKEKTQRPSLTALTDRNAAAIDQSGRPSLFSFKLSRKRLEYGDGNTGNQLGRTVFLDKLPDSDTDETQRALEMSKREAERAELEKEKRQKREQEELMKAMEESKQAAHRSISEMSEEQQLAYALAISTQDVSVLKSDDCFQDDQEALRDTPSKTDASNLSHDIEDTFVSLKRRGMDDAVQSLDKVLHQSSGDHIGIESKENGTPCKRFKTDCLASNQSTPSEHALGGGDGPIDLTGETQDPGANRTKPHPWRRVKKSIANFFSPAKQTQKGSTLGLDSDFADTPLSAIKPTLLEATAVDICREDDHSTLQVGVNGDTKPSYEELKAKEDEELRRATQLSLLDAQEIDKREEDALKRAKQISLQEFSESFTCLEDDDDAAEPMEIDEESDDDATKELAKNAESGHLPLSYHLTSIVSHIGSTSLIGHYISDVFDSKKSTWLSYDDSQVVRMSESAVREDRERTGYIFFYIAK